VTTFSYAFTVDVLLTDLGTVHEVPGFAVGWPYAAFALQTLWTAIHSAASPAHPASPPAAAQAPGPEQGIAIVCAGSPNPKNPAAYRAEAAFARARSGAAGPDIAWRDEPCAGWRASDAEGYFGPWNHRTAHPLLLVGNTFDPQTPYQDSVAMANELARARLLTVDGDGHTALFNPSRCVQNYEASYFIHGTLPPAGTVCHQNRPPFTPSSRP
jgi:hypothetical protein